MKKRGQITLFVILGIVIVVVIGLLLYTRTNLFMFNPTAEDLDNVMYDIKQHVRDCVDNFVDGPDDEILIRIAKQGGYLASPGGTYRLYNDYPVAYLCYNMRGDARCMNRLLLKSSMEDEISRFLKSNLPRCLDVQAFKKFGGFNIIAEILDVDAEIGKDVVTINVKYPVTLMSLRSDAVAKETDFVRVFNYPLGDLYKVSQDIIDYETEFGDFDQLIYMLAYKGTYKIEKKRPYPDKLYILSRNDNPEYEFQFFIESEPA